MGCCTEVKGIVKEQLEEGKLCLFKAIFFE